MILAGPLLADLFLSLTAVIGMVVLHRVIASRGAWEPLNRRFLFGIRVTIVLFAARGLSIITGVGLFGAVLLMAAALIPLAVLMLTEGLLRRHAPRWAKLFVAGGAVVFVLWIAVPFGSYKMDLYALLAFQIAGLMISGWLVISRDRSSLSAPENRAVERLGLSLLALVPLAVTDFLTVQMGVPVQASPLAVLLLCWLAIGLGGPDARHRASLLGIAIAVGVAITATGVLSLAFAMPRDGVLVTGAVVLAAILLYAVTMEARHQRDDAQNLSILSHLAEAEGSAMAFLGKLQEHPMVEGSAVLGPEVLEDLDRAALERLFARRPVIRRADIWGEGQEGDYARHLFARYGASHVFWVSGDPLRLVALSMPSVAASSTTELELAAVQRMAALLAAGERDGSQSV